MNLSGRPRPTRSLANLVCPNGRGGPSEACRTPLYYVVEGPLKEQTRILNSAQLVAASPRRLSRSSLSVQLIDQSLDSGKLS